MFIGKNCKRIVDLLINSSEKWEEFPTRSCTLIYENRIKIDFSEELYSINIKFKSESDGWKTIYFGLFERRKIYKTIINRIHLINLANMHDLNKEFEDYIKPANSIDFVKEK